MDKREMAQAKHQALGIVASLAVQIRKLEAEQAENAGIAAQMGASATEIADAFGTISRQTAYNRYLKQYKG